MNSGIVEEEKLSSIHIGNVTYTPIHHGVRHMARKYEHERS